MNKGLLAGSFRTVMNNISSLDDTLFTEMLERVKAERAIRKPTKTVGTGKRGRKPIYNSVEERKQAIEARRQAKMIERNNNLILSGQPIPHRGRPRKIKVD